MKRGSSVLFRNDPLQKFAPSRASPHDKSPTDEGEPRTTLCTAAGMVARSGTLFGQHEIMNSSDLQRRLAKTFGVDVNHDNFHIAAARLYEAIWPAVEIHEAQQPASSKQVAFAKDVGLDIAGIDRASASQRIAARLKLLNEVALRALDLNPGDRVVLKETPKATCIISCVGRNRKIYLKGWGGQSVWATQVLKKK